MSNISRIQSLFLLLISITIISCSDRKDRNKTNSEVRKVYVELKGTPESVTDYILQSMIDRRDTIGIQDEQQGNVQMIVYSFYDAKELPESNILDGTRKLRLELYSEVDSVGNPYYSYSWYKSSNSEWIRTMNFAKRSINQDSLVSEQFIKDLLVSLINIRMLKQIP